jgi:hypothetical protein
LRKDDELGENTAGLKRGAMNREQDDLLDKMKRIYGEKITRAAFIESPSEKENPKA